MEDKIIVQEYEYEGKIPLEKIEEIHNITQLLLPKNYILITTPLKTYMVNSDDKIIYIDTKSYSLNELLRIFEKYDDLCE